MSGVEVLKRIREKEPASRSHAHRQGRSVDRIIGLELGADDYVPKPCPPRELAARLNAILRRTANMPSAIAPVVAGPLTINPSRREATANGIVIDLTGTELTLLEVLARKVGTPVPKDEIYQKVLGRAMQRYDRAIDVHVSLDPPQARRRAWNERRDRKHPRRGLSVRGPLIRCIRRLAVPPKKKE